MSKVLTEQYSKKPEPLARTYLFVTCHTQFSMVRLVVYFALLLGASQLDACSFAHSGLPMPADHPHVHAPHALRYPKASVPSDPGYIPDRISASGNAFISQSLLRPSLLAGGSKLLVDQLLDFAATQSEPMCYWSFQPLAAPTGPGPIHWNFANGQWDADLEYESMLSSVASARLQRLQNLHNSTLLSTACAVGRDKAQRRCKNGQAQKEFWRDACSPVIMDQKLRWGMAIALFKIDSSLKELVRYHRSNSTFGHTPMIQWTYRGGSKPFGTWAGKPTPPTDIDPEGMPHGPTQWPASQGKQFNAGPGAAMLAKVVPCAEVASKFQNPPEQFYCDHVSHGSNQTTADEAYELWNQASSVWPPTKPCTDDVAALNAVFKLYTNGTAPAFSDCVDAHAHLTAAIPNFDCDAVWGLPGTRIQFRDSCCSQCGSDPIPDLPPLPAPVKPASPYVCTSCGHWFNASEDASGVSFDELDDDWRCPICGMPKSAYKKVNGKWWHPDASHTQDSIHER